MRLNFISCACVALLTTVAFDVRAAEKTSMDILQEQYAKNREQVEDIFKQKVDKIRERTALPEKMRAVLVKQANEMREFDLYTLDRKLELKVRQMQERDALKNELKRELLEKETKAFAARPDASANIANVKAEVKPVEKVSSVSEKKPSLPTELNQIDETPLQKSADLKQ